MSISSRVFSISAAVLVAASHTGRAADLLTYNFDSLDGTPSFQAPGVTGSLFDRDQDHFIAYSVLTGSPQPAAIGNAWDTASFDASRYFTFSLTAAASLTINSVALDLQSTPEDGGDGGPTLYAIRSSLDGFAADNISGSLSGGFLTSTFSPNAVLGAGETVEFRVYAWGTANSGATVAADNVHLTGIAPVPEPISVVPVGLALIGLAAGRRLNRRSN